MAEAYSNKYAVQKEASLSLTERRTLHRQQQTVSTSIRVSQRKPQGKVETCHLQVMGNFYSEGTEKHNMAMGLMSVMEHLLAETVTGDAYGYCSFEEAYNIYAAHFENHVQEDTFRDVLLGSDGLPVTVFHHPELHM